MPQSYKNLTVIRAVVTWKVGFLGAKMTKFGLTETYNNCKCSLDFLRELEFIKS